MQELLNRLLRKDDTMMPYGRTIGFRVESVHEDQAVVSIPCSESVHNVFGYTRGGAFISIADTAIGLAHLSSIVKEQTATTVESSIHYLRPARAGTLRASARALKQGRTLSVYECEVADETGLLIARVSATMMTLEADRSHGRSKLYGAEGLVVA